jgi:hypothetical protein
VAFSTREDTYQASKDRQVEKSPIEIKILPSTMRFSATAGNQFEIAPE